MNVLGSLCIQCIVIVTSALLLQLTDAKIDKNLYCSVCRALVDEVTVRIGDADPKKKVKVGSFRVDPNGNQKLVEKQYARSDQHLSEIFDTVCESMMDYGLTQSREGNLGVIRLKSHSGEKLDVLSIGNNENLQLTFRHYCNTLLEHFEDEMVTIFKEENLQTVESKLCGEVAKVCTDDELSRPFPKPKSKEESLENSFYEKEELEVNADDEDVEDNVVEPPSFKKKARSDDNDEL